MSTGAPEAGGPRAEHDALAKRLEVRVSVDHLKKGLTRIFLGLIAAGLAVRLAWDRWGALKPGVVRRVFKGPPMFLWIAGAAAVLLLLAGLVALVRARSLSKEEDRLFARLRELRAQLGIDR